MKKVGDLMAELGFRAEGSDSVKRAFIENLVRAAGGEKVRPIPTRTPLPKSAQKEEQLSFNFDAPPASVVKRPTG